MFLFVTFSCKCVCVLLCVLPLCVTLYLSTYPPTGDPFSLMEETHALGANLTLNSHPQTLSIYILSTYCMAGMC